MPFEKLNAKKIGLAMEKIYHSKAKTVFLAFLGVTVFTIASLPPLKAQTIPSNTISVIKNGKVEVLSEAKAIKLAQSLARKKQYSVAQAIINQLLSGTPQNPYAIAQVSQGIAAAQAKFQNLLSATTSALGVQDYTLAGELYARMMKVNPYPSSAARSKLAKIALVLKIEKLKPIYAKVTETTNVDIVKQDYTGAINSYMRSFQGFYTLIKQENPNEPRAIVDYTIFDRILKLCADYQKDYKPYKKAGDLITSLMSGNPKGTDWPRVISASTDALIPALNTLISDKNQMMDLSAQLEKNLNSVTASYKKRGVLSSVPTLMRYSLNLVKGNNQEDLINGMIASMSQSWTSYLIDLERGLEQSIIRTSSLGLGALYSFKNKQALHYMDQVKRATPAALKILETIGIKNEQMKGKLRTNSDYVFAINAFLDRYSNLAFYKAQADLVTTLAQNNLLQGVSLDTSKVHDFISLEKVINKWLGNLSELKRLRSSWNDTLSQLGKSLDDTNFSKPKDFETLTKRIYVRQSQLLMGYKKYSAAISSVPGAAQLPSLAQENQQLLRTATLLTNTPPKGKKYISPTAARRANNALNKVITNLKKSSLTLNTGAAGVAPPSQAKLRSLIRGASTITAQIGAIAQNAQALKHAGAPDKKLLKAAKGTSKSALSLQKEIDGMARNFLTLSSSASAFAKEDKKLKKQVSALSLHLSALSNAILNQGAGQKGSQRFKVFQDTATARRNVRAMSVALAKLVNPAEIPQKTTFNRLLFYSYRFALDAKSALSKSLQNSPIDNAIADYKKGLSKKVDKVIASLGTDLNTATKSFFNAQKETLNHNITGLGDDYDLISEKTQFGRNFLKNSNVKTVKVSSYISPAKAAGILLKDNQTIRVTRARLRAMIRSARSISPKLSSGNMNSYIRYAQGALNRLDSVASKIDKLNKQLNLDTKLFNDAKFAGDQAYKAAQSFYRNSNFNEALRQIDQAKKSYNTAITMRYQKPLLHAITTTLPNFRKEVLLSQRQAVLAAMRQYLDATLLDYQRGLYSEAYTNLMEAELQWKAAYGSSKVNSEIEYWKQLLSDAMSAQSSIKLLRSDRSYNLLSQYLNQAQKGVRIAQKPSTPLSQRSANIKTADTSVNNILSQKPSYIDALTILFEVNRLKNPAGFSQYVRQYYSEAEKLVSENPIQAYADMKVVEKFNPTLPRLRQTIYDLEITLHLKLRPASPKAKQKSEQNIKEATTIIQNEDRTQYSKAMSLLEEAQVLTPQNSTIGILRDRLVTLKNSSDLNILTPADREQYAQALTDFLHGDYYTALGIVNALLALPRNKTNPTLLGLKSKIGVRL